MFNARIPRLSNWPEDASRNIVMRFALVFANRRGKTKRNGNLG